MSNGIFSKIGRALSIFGVSSPDDIRKMEQRKTAYRSISRTPETPRPDPVSHPEEAATEVHEKGKIQPQ